VSLNIILKRGQLHPFCVSSTVLLGIIAIMAVLLYASLSLC
jgi:hypothetical protein